MKKENKTLLALHTMVHLKLKQKRNKLSKSMINFYHLKEHSIKKITITAVKMLHVLYSNLHK